MESDESPWSLHPSADELQRAMDTLNAGLVVRTVAGQILYANDRMLEWVGYTPQELEGENVLVLVPKELQEASAEEMREMAAGDERARIGIIRRKDGRTFPIVTCPHVLRKDDQILGIVAVFLDLGEIQTARRVGTSSGPSAALADSLERIAGELQMISLSASQESVSGTSLDHPELESLSAREREILAELVSGLRAPAIAKKLFISPHTVRNHLKSMYRKLDVPDQAALIAHVRELAASRTGGGGAEGERPS